jgi:segregation and condensation protein B
MQLTSKLEAILFYKAEPVSVKDLSRILGVGEEETERAINELKESLFGRGITLIQNDNKVMLGTSPGASELIEEIRKEELSRDLGKAGLETLAIILYKKGVGRKEIEYIRGVNSSFILRSLMIRGLVEREESTLGMRGYIYKPTIELISLLGISKPEDLSGYANVLQEFEEFSKSSERQAEENDGG